MKKRFEPHSHSEYSNLRLLDCINKIPKLIDRAIELNLSGVALTDHECLSAHVRAEKYMKTIQEKYLALYQSENLYILINGLYLI